MPSLNERIGVIGIPSDWLIASVPPDDVLSKLNNFEFIKIPIQKLYKLYDAVLPNTTGNLLKSFKIENNSINNTELRKAEAFYLALKRLVVEYQLTALTIRCFDLLIEYHTTGCFALSKLNDEGIISGCEGDIVSLIGMIVATRKTGQTVWMANPSQIDIENSELVLAHCTVPTCLTNAVSLDTHFESDQGIGLKGIIPESEATLFRLGGKNLDKKFVCTGKIIRQEYSSKPCRTQIRVKVYEKDKLKELLTNPLGNHLLVISGMHLDILNNFIKHEKIHQSNSQTTL